MSIECFEGGAGTGKTTSLMASLQSRLETVPLTDGQGVLALTFMHGSRHRLANRLRRVPLARANHECMTIDSFAWHLVCRWRGVLAVAQNGTCDVARWSFDERCEAATRLLALDNVRSWVCRRFPVVIVDEMQDVREARLSIIQRLSETAFVIVAADEFQDLHTVGDNAAVAWLRGNSTPRVLTQNHRTTCGDLLASAAELRGAQPLVDRDRCKVLSAANPNAAAGMVACNLVWFGIRGTVLLTPTGPDSSTFVRKVIERLQAKPIKPGALKGAEVGPFLFDWESHASSDAGRLVDGLNIQQGAVEVDTRTLCIPQAIRGGRSLQEWVDRQRRVFGRDRIGVEVLKEEAGRVCQQLRAMRVIGDGKLAAMTLHQAKNREFERVIILWPYEVSGAAEKLRRLLYNGITRAQQRAAIVVQNPPTGNPNRLTIPPFVV